LHRLFAAGIAGLSPDMRRICALLDPACTSERCREVLGAGESLFDLARGHSVAGIVADRWMSELSEEVPPAELNRWRGLAYSTALQPIQRRRDTIGVLSALADAGVDPIVMRGLWLGEVIYGNPGLRPHTDIDLIIPIDGINPAIDALRPLGYAPVADEGPVDTDEIRARLARGFRARFSGTLKCIDQPEKTTVDLHVTPHMVPLGWWPQRPSPEELHARSEPWTVDGVTVRALKPYFALVALTENVTRHGLARSSYGNCLVRFCDMMRLSRRLSAQEWEWAIEDARKFRLGIQLGVILQVTAELWGEQWPPGTVEQLARPRIAARMVRCAMGRPWWLGHCGRVALLLAASTGSAPEAVRYLVKNIGPAIGSYFR